MDVDNYSGTTTTTLTVMNVMEANEGSFACVVTDAVDSVTSSAAQLTVRKCVCVCVCVCVHMHSCVFVASFPGLPTIQLVIAYSMQKQRENA